MCNVTSGEEMQQLDQEHRVQDLNEGSEAPALNLPVAQLFNPSMCEAEVCRFNINDPRYRMCVSRSSSTAPMMLYMLKLADC